MKKIILIFMVFIFVINGCSTNNLESNDKEVLKDLELKHNEIIILQEKIATLEKQLVDERNSLIKEQKNNSDKNTKLDRIIGSLEAQLLFSNPRNTPFIYEVNPKPTLYDGWYIIKDAVTITFNNELLKIPNPQSCRFLETTIGTEMVINEIYVDNDATDGFQYKGIISNMDQAVFWMEITDNDGKVHLGPLMPIWNGIVQID